MSNVHASLYNGKVEIEDLPVQAAEPDRPKPPPVTEAERQGLAYLEDGRRRALRRQRGYRIDKRLEEKPDGDEPEYRRVCRTARNLLKSACGKPDALDLWHVYDCREEMRRQTREASHRAAVWLEKNKREQQILKAEAEGRHVCADCGREIDERYSRCFSCNSKYRAGVSGG